MGVNGMWGQFETLESPISPQDLGKKFEFLVVDMSGVLHRLATRGLTSVEMLKGDYGSLAKAARAWVAMLAALMRDSATGGARPIHCVFDGQPPRCKQVAEYRRAARQKSREMALALLSQQDQDKAGAGAGIEDQDDNGDEGEDGDKSKAFVLDSSAGRRSLLESAAKQSISISMEAVEAVCAAIKSIPGVLIVLSGNEADSQMAYEVASLGAGAVLTEDSDLLVFFRFFRVPVIHRLHGNKLQHMQLLDIGSPAVTKSCIDEWENFKDSTDVNKKKPTLPVVWGSALSANISPGSVLSGAAAMVGCDFKTRKNVGHQKACTILLQVISEMDQAVSEDDNVGEISPAHLHEVAADGRAIDKVPSVKAIATCMCAFELPLVFRSAAGDRPIRLLEAGEKPDRPLPPCVLELLELLPGQNQSWRKIGDLPGAGDGEESDALEQFGVPTPWPPALREVQRICNESGGSVQREFDEQFAEIDLPPPPSDTQSPGQESADAGAEAREQALADLLDQHPLVMARSRLNSAISNRVDLKVLTIHGPQGWVPGPKPCETRSAVAEALSKFKCLIERGRLTLDLAKRMKTNVMSLLLDCVQFSFVIIGSARSID